MNCGLPSPELGWDYGEVEAEPLNLATSYTLRYAVPFVIRGCQCMAIPLRYNLPKRQEATPTLGHRCTLYNSRIASLPVVATLMGSPSFGNH